MQAETRGFEGWWCSGIGSSIVISSLYWASPTSEPHCNGACLLSELLRLGIQHKHILNANGNPAGAAAGSISSKSKSLLFPLPCCSVYHLLAGPSPRARPLVQWTEARHSGEPKPGQRLPFWTGVLNRCTLAFDETSRLSLLQSSALLQQ